MSSARMALRGFPFGKDAIGTNLYAWCGNNPVTREDPSGNVWQAYDFRVPYLYTQWVRSYINVPIYSVYWLYGIFPIPYIAGWRTISFSYPVVRLGWRTVTRYRWVEPPSQLVKNYEKSSRIAAIDCRRISYGPLTDGHAGAWGDTWDHYTGTEKSNSLENAAYDFGSMIPATKILAAPSAWNTYRDWKNDHISFRRFLWNESLTVTGIVFIPSSAISGFTNVMDYADEHGWLDNVNGLLGKD